MIGKLAKRLWHLSTTYRMYDFIRSSVQYSKSYKYVSDTFYSSAFSKVIKKYLGINLKKDWIGRLYGVANPTIKNGKLDLSSVIIEIDGDNTNTNESVKHWVFNQMQLIADLFKIEKMYDYISLEFRHVGPEEFDNYLVVFDITARQVWSKSAKNLLWNLAGICIAVYALLKFGVF